MMPTFDSLTPREQEIVKDMSDFARACLTDAGFKVLNDDRVARFDEACAVYFVQCRDYTQERDK
jgi:hypothetical protein